MLRRHLRTALRRLMASGYRPLNRIELNRSALVHNVRFLQGQNRGLIVIPVLKGNAYGHGIEPIALGLQGVVDMVAVDGYHEAEAIHVATGHHVLVMGYILPQNVRLLDTRHCSFVVQDIVSLEAFGALKKPVRVHLELNTGMNRLGLSPDELEPYLATLRRYSSLKLEGVMSHLADADNPTSNAYSVAQASRFDEQVERILDAGFRPRYIHLAQSAGSVKVRSRHANAVRMGLSIYGINPLEPADPEYKKFQDLRPVLELKSTVIKTLELQAGDKVGYNGSFTAPRAMRVGVLPLGYHEGMPRELSNRGYVMYQNQALPILGRVCMNHTIIDLSGTSLQIGDEITAISSDPRAPNSVAALQAKYQLFDYATINKLSGTIKRQLV